MNYISNTFFAAIQNLSNGIRNSEMGLQAMKRNMIQTIKLLQAQHVNNLFKKLCERKVGNAETEQLCKKLCRLIPNKSKTLVEIVTE